jgi:hypothetical protein
MLKIFDDETALLSSRKVLRLQNPTFVMYEVIVNQWMR